MFIVYQCYIIVIQYFCQDRIPYPGIEFSPSFGSIIFSCVSESFNNIDISYNAAPSFTDLDNDGVLDLLIGDGNGYIHHYVQDNPGSLTFSVVTDTFNNIDAGRFVAPTCTDLDEDGLLDLIIGNGSGKIIHYKQNTVGSTDFAEVTTLFSSIDIGNHAAPCFTDLDGDGLLDLIIGESDGFVNHYEQDAAHSQNFAQVSDDFCSVDNIAVVLEATPCIADIDSDGLWDMLIGDNRSGRLSHYKQVQAGSDEFILVSDQFSGIDIGNGTTAPTITDLNNNGLLDLIIGTDKGNLYYFEQ